MNERREREHDPVQASRNHQESSLVSAQARLRAELALPPRIAHTLLLLVATAMAAVLASLLLTEPSLPSRTSLAFAIMLVIALCWIVYAIWVLQSRRVLLGEHQVIAARMATVFALVFTVGAIAFAPWQANRSGALAIVMAGSVMLVFAGVRLLQATRRRRALRERRASLERDLRGEPPQGPRPTLPEEPPRGALPLLIVLVTGVGAAVPNALVAQQARTHESSGSFVVRGDSIPVFEGLLRVPANRSRDRRDTLTLRYVRFPSTSTTPAAPIVFLAGGPGDAATRAVQGMPRELLDALRSTADVVAFDQRGTGRSEPRAVLCPPGALLSRSQPANPDSRVVVLADRVRRCLADTSRADLDMSGLNTSESAHDLEALRTALDVKQLSLLAGSYGTHLALAYAREYPKAAQRMVLVGVEGPDHTLKLPSRVQQVLSKIAEQKRPALMSELDTLRRTMRESPVAYAFPTGQTIVLGEWDLQRYVAESLDTVREIDAMVANMSALVAGDYAPLARWALRDRAPRPLNLMNLAMDCASSGSRGRLAQIRTEAPDMLLGDAINFPLPALCDQLGLMRLPASFRAPLVSDVSALLVAGEFDARTPVANAYEVSANMPNARVMLVRAVSHDLFGAPQVTAAMLDYFRR